MWEGACEKVRRGSPNEAHGARAPRARAVDGVGAEVQPEEGHVVLPYAAAAQLRNLLAIVPADDQVDIRSAGGSGAGLFLLPPDLPDHTMSDDHLIVALRRRLSRCSRNGTYVKSKTRPDFQSVCVSIWKCD